MLHHKSYDLLQVGKNSLYHAALRVIEFEAAKRGAHKLMAEEESMAELREESIL